MSRPRVKMYTLHWKYYFLRYLAIISRKTNIPIFGPFSNTNAKDSRIVLLIIDPNDQLHPIGIAIQVCTQEVVGVIDLLNYERISLLKRPIHRIKHEKSRFNKLTSVRVFFFVIAGVKQCQIFNALSVYSWGPDYYYWVINIFMDEVESNQKHHRKVVITTQNKSM